MNEADITDVSSSIALDEIGADTFQNLVNEINITGTIYGGQVLANALHAAIRTVTRDRSVHSLHAYFLRPGRAGPPITYKVERTREGRSFSTRRVVAVQDDTTLFHMEASFHALEQGYVHEQPPRTDLPEPESLPHLIDIAGRAGFPDRGRMARYRTIDLRLVDSEKLLRQSDEPRIGSWMRIPSAAGLPPNLQACALAYASDAWLIPAAVTAHQPAFHAGPLKVATLDHSIWFHAPVQCEAWHLFEAQSPWAGQGRGLALGRIYTQDGKLVASVAQEGMLRLSQS